MDKNSNDSKGFAIIFLVILVLMFFYLAYFFITYKEV